MTSFLQTRGQEQSHAEIDSKKVEAEAAAAEEFKKKQQVKVTIAWNLFSLFSKLLHN